jgi:hypothetical protein
MGDIVPFLKDSSFSPEEVEVLNIAFQNACAAICGASPPAEEKSRIARKVIALALTGERDPSQLYIRCINHPTLMATKAVGVSSSTRS